MLLILSTSKLFAFLNMAFLAAIARDLLKTFRIINRQVGTNTLILYLIVNLTWHQTWQNFFITYTTVTFFLGYRLLVAPFSISFLKSSSISISALANNLVISSISSTAPTLLLRYYIVTIIYRHIIIYVVSNNIMDLCILITFNVIVVGFNSQPSYNQRQI